MNQEILTIVGASGFLGWHVQMRAQLRGFEVRLASAREGKTEELTTAIDGADWVMHLAACNRPLPGKSLDDAAKATLEAFQRTADAVLSASKPPSRIVIAGTTQTGTAYGDAKESGSKILFEVGRKVNAKVTEWLLPNLFGEHGRPRHNMVTATFIESLLDGEAPTIHGDKPIVLLAARHAVDLLLSPATEGRKTISEEDAPLRHTTVPELFERLRSIHEPYQGQGQLPDLSDAFTAELTAAYLSHAFLRRQAIPLTAHSDNRGCFFETVRSEGGGQVSFSTTKPGITRGNHFHLRKIERFVVLSGEARIGLRKFGSNDIVNLEVSGESPEAVDMPIGWSHNITNIGEDILYTQFWISELYNPENPDTFPEEV